MNSFMIVESSVESLSASAMPASSRLMVNIRSRNSLCCPILASPRVSKWTIQSKKSPIWTGSTYCDWHSSKYFSWSWPSRMGFCRDRTRPVHRANFWWSGSVLLPDCSLIILVKGLVLLSTSEIARLMCLKIGDLTVVWNIFLAGFVGVLNVVFGWMDIFDVLWRFGDKWLALSDRRSSNRSNPDSSPARLYRSKARRTSPELDEIFLLQNFTAFSSTGVNSVCTRDRIIAVISSSAYGWKVMWCGQYVWSISLRTVRSSVLAMPMIIRRQLEISVQLKILQYIQSTTRNKAT